MEVFGVLGITSVGCCSTENSTIWFGLAGIDVSVGLFSEGDFLGKFAVAVPGNEGCFCT